MASPLQNRIVGTAILIALAVIFLPDLLDGQKVTRDDDIETIPLRPELTVAQAEPEFPVDFDRRIEEAQPQEAQEFVAIPEPTAASLSSDPDTPAWVVRLGAFRNTESVQRLVTTLRENGFNAYSRSQPSQNGELRVLYVGPDLSADILEQQLPELKSLTDLDGQIVPYQPASNE